MKFPIIVFFVLVFSLSVFAVTEKDTMQIYAVTPSGEAVSATLTLELRPGSGKIWSDTDPLVGTSTQSAEKTAIRVAKNYSSETESYDYFFDIDSDASLVEGPSAGAAMALIAVSQLQGKNLPQEVSMTGTISEDGRVGAVGGVFEKSREASSTGIKLFMIPEGEGRQTVRLEDGVQTIYLPDYALDNWNIKVVEVSDIDQALKLAFSDIEEIDINAVSAPVKEFTPAAIQYHASLELMKGLSLKYIDDANISLIQARIALSNSLIDDSSTLEFLLATINSADRSLFQARELYENNYLYSAANLSFLGIVYTSLVKDISDNPSLLSADSTLFDIKLNELKQDITVLKNSLNQDIPLDYLEWHISSQQRLSWSELKVKELSETRTIEIQVNGQPITSEEIAFQKMEDYEFALAWYKVAEDFYHETQKSKKKANISTVKNFQNAPRQFIVEAENGMSILESEGLEDAQRRLNASILESNNGWFLSSMLDSSTSLALINAESITRNKSREELSSLLEEKVSAMEKKLSQNKYNNEWGHLYLDHAKYFLNSAAFYHESGFESKSSENLKNGVTLALFAESTFNAMKQINEYYDSVPASQISSQPLTSSAQSSSDLQLLVILVLVAIALLVVASAKLFLTAKKPSNKEAETPAKKSRFAFEK